MAKVWMFVVVLLGGSSWAYAQTGVGLATSPWDRHQTFQADGDAWTVDAKADTLSVTRHRGRVRFEDDLSLGGLGQMAAGFEYTHLHLTSNQAQVPARLSRGEAAVGFPLGDVVLFGKPWKAGGTAGGGWASSDAWFDTHGLFALGTVFAQRHAWGGLVRVGLTFDGNRSVLPDMPLPVLSYEPGAGEDGENRDASKWGLTLGYPTSRVTWRAHDKLVFSAGLDRLDALSADVRYDLTAKVSLVAAYGGFYDQFHVEDDAEHRRVFFVSQRFEAGAEMNGAWGRIGLSGGYAFGQELRRGYGLRSTTVIAAFDDGPFVRLAWRVGF